MATYNIQPLNFLPNSSSSWAYGLNSNGRTAGVTNFPQSTQYEEAVIWDGANPTLVPTPGTASAIFGLNDLGDVVGGWTPQSTGVVTGHAFAVLQGGNFIDLSSQLGVTHAFARAINNQQHAIVNIGINPDKFMVVDLSGSGDPPEVVQVKANFDHIWAGAINNNGASIGRVEKSNGGNQGFIYSNGQFDLIGTVFFIEDINDAGLVVGNRVFGGREFPTAFRYDSASSSPVFQDLGYLPLPGHNASNGGGVNSAGMQVGDSGEYYGSATRHAFIHDGTTMNDLNDLIPSGSGWDLIWGHDIDDDGRILCTGRYNGEQQPVLLVPKGPGVPPYHLDEMLVMTILFGVTQDGGGLGWLPGKGPVPIDPWGPFRLSPGRRDRIIAQAISRLAAAMGDQVSRRDLDAAVQKVIKRIDQG